ncbi:MAG: hypothetical protein DSO09_05495 [Candidatus Methanomethylicota archaeon]|jgi:hypothetical protein|uniref:Uncharacterized protein n=1 Tax=Thermoproteota archaeon TaxID=2056631 RepID=A0A523BBW1_9CREN|nr:MAG: hypothetical protein EF809_00130 [Candidatus Verstraetearchaeota archaeon]TDA37960.1 MAG: hypothetical protein DSO09_05495 [Candidatus Verstraetearchaeota archaeon]
MKISTIIFGISLILIFSPTFIFYLYRKNDVFSIILYFIPFLIGITIITISEKLFKIELS